jgi:hypothetical protein
MISKGPCASRPSTPTLVYPYALVCLAELTRYGPCRYGASLEQPKIQLESRGSTCIPVRIAFPISYLLSHETDLVSDRKTNVKPCNQFPGCFASRSTDLIFSYRAASSGNVIELLRGQGSIGVYLRTFTVCRMLLLNLVQLYVLLLTHLL